VRQYNSLQLEQWRNLLESAEWRELLLPELEELAVEMDRQVHQCSTWEGTLAARSNLELLKKVMNLGRDVLQTHDRLKTENKFLQGGLK
jgi:hypothetical protein